VVAFDVTTVSPGSRGFAGAAFDGRYIYLVPYSNGAPDGAVVRYDTQAVFAAGASWSIFDVATVNTRAKGFCGAVFDGRYLYLVPQYNGLWDGVVARYDTQDAFTTGAAWSTFDLQIISSEAVAFSGATFDGRFIYLVPGATYNRMARYDTQAAFATSASWSFSTSRPSTRARWRLRVLRSMAATFTTRPSTADSTASSLHGMIRRGHLRLADHGRCSTSRSQSRGWTDSSARCSTVDTSTSFPTPHVSRPLRHAGAVWLGELVVTVSGRVEL